MGEGTGIGACAPHSFSYSKRIGDIYRRRVIKFKYKQCGDGFIRPIIFVDIEYDEKSVPYTVLIDSGADYCVFDQEIAGILGINVLGGPGRIAVGITGAQQTFYIHEVVINVGGHRRNINAGFMEMNDSMRYGVLGQQGFFENFIVKFDYKKEEVEIFIRE